MSKQEVSNLINKLNNLYEGVVIDGDDIGIRIRHDGFNTINTHTQYIYKNTCLVRCTGNGFYETYSINYKASSKEEQERIDAYKEYFLSEGYTEREIEETEFPNYFIDLNNAKEPTPEDYLRVATGFTDYDSVIESGRINEDYVYVAFQPRDKYIITNLNYLYILKVGKTLEDVVIFNGKSVMFQTTEELRVELAITISFLIGKEDNNIIRKIESGNLYKECYYQVYSIDEGYGGGYRYIIYIPEGVEDNFPFIFGYNKDIRIYRIKQLESLNELLIDLAIHKKFIKLYLDSYNLLDYLDLIEDDEACIGNKLIGKTIEVGILEIGAMKNEVYEIYKVNEEYGGGYELIIWDYNDYNNLNNCSKHQYHAETLEEIAEYKANKENELKEEFKKEQQLWEIHNIFMGQGLGMGG